MYNRYLNDLRGYSYVRKYIRKSFRNRLIKNILNYFKDLISVLMELY
jgi:hypothetical protein